jgi:hypothetical protein
MEDDRHWQNVHFLRICIQSFCKKNLLGEKNTERYACFKIVDSVFL